ncbi:MAG TPA: hypothetical protein VJZ16_06085 [Syntrophales bacterium]|nr:MAG: hypothetical protein UY65_C0006G0010 [Parcubacteria group bacterium GW2011_GWA2_51_12]HLA05531.1 hypothetical protein [Syntrophales bacterium]
MHYVRKGLVTVRENGKVVLKIASGCGGEMAAKVADIIKAKGYVPHPTEIFPVAQRVGFGLEGELVVINCHNQCMHNLAQGYPVIHNYSQDFQNAEYHPATRTGGVCNHVAIVDL